DDNRPSDERGAGEDGTPRSASEVPEDARADRTPRDAEEQEAEARREHVGAPLDGRSYHACPPLLEPGARHDAVLHSEECDQKAVDDERFTDCPHRTPEVHVMKPRDVPIECSPIVPDESDCIRKRGGEERVYSEPVHEVTRAAHGG